MTEGKEFDVAVVGGGPGGSVAATFLGRAGIRTLLVDKARFPRDKACGDAVGPESVRVLRELGIEEELVRETIGRIRGQLYSSPSGDAAQLPLPPRKDEPGFVPDPANGYSSLYCIPRTILDNAIFQCAKREPLVETMEEFTLTDLLWDGRRVAGIVGSGRDGRVMQIKARLVIGADGAMSRVAEKVGAYDYGRKNRRHWIAAFRMYYDGVKGLSDNIEIHFADPIMPGYFWIFPVGNGRANVGAGMIELDLKGERSPFHTKKTNMRAETQRLLTGHPMFSQRFAGAVEVPNSFRGWQLPCGSERRKLGGDGWMLVGDAASLIDPFSGEGIPNAMLSGKFAAECGATALRRGDVGEASLKPYEERVWRELGPQLETSYRLQGIARRKWLLNFLVRTTARKESVRRALTEMLADHTKSVQLTRPMFYLKMLFG